MWVSFEGTEAKAPLGHLTPPHSRMETKAVWGASHTAWGIKAAGVSHNHQLLDRTSQRTCWIEEVPAFRSPFTTSNPGQSVLSPDFLTASPAFPSPQTQALTDLA